MIYSLSFHTSQVSTTTGKNNVAKRRKRKFEVEARQCGRNVLVGSELVDLGVTRGANNTDALRRDEEAEDVLGVQLTVLEVAGVGDMALYLLLSV